MISKHLDWRSRFAESNYRQTWTLISRNFLHYDSSSRSLFLDMKTENYERRESWSFISDFSTSIVRLSPEGRQNENVRERARSEKGAEGWSSQESGRYCRNTCNYQRRQQLRASFYGRPSRHRDIIISVVSLLFLLFSFSFSLPFPFPPSEKWRRESWPCKKSLTSGQAESRRVKSCIANDQVALLLRRSRK